MPRIKQKIKVEKKRSGIKAKVKPERKISGVKSSVASRDKKIIEINKKYDVEMTPTYSDKTRYQIVTPYFNTLLDINKNEFGGSGIIEKYGNTSSYVLYTPSIYSKGGSMATGGGIGIYSAEEQKNWSDKKSKIYDEIAYQVNKIEDLKEELERQTKRGDKVSIDRIKERIKISKKHINKLEQAFSKSDDDNSMATGGITDTWEKDINDVIGKLLDVYENYDFESESGRPMLKKIIDELKVIRYKSKADAIKELEAQADSLGDLQYLGYFSEDARGIVISALNILNDQIDNPDKKYSGGSMARGGEIESGTFPNKISKEEALKLFNEGVVVYVKTEPNGKIDTSNNAFPLRKDLRNVAGMNIYLGGETQGEYGFDNILKWIKERTSYPNYNFEFYTLNSDRSWFLENGKTLENGGLMAKGGNNKRISEGETIEAKSNVVDGFFSTDKKTFINISVPKSSPDRKGKVISVSGDGKSANVEFSDFVKRIPFDISKSSGGSMATGGSVDKLTETRDGDTIVLKRGKKVYAEIYYNKNPDYKWVLSLNPKAKSGMALSGFESSEAAIKRANELNDEFNQTIKSFSTSMETGGKTKEDFKIGDKVKFYIGGYKDEDLAHYGTIQSLEGDYPNYDKRFARVSGLGDPVEKDKLIKVEGIAEEMFPEDAKILKNKYKSWWERYDYLGAHLEDAIEEKDEAKIKKLKTEMDELESKMHRYERNYQKGGKAEDDYTKNLGMVEVIFADPKYNYQTNVSGDTTEEQAREYFVGKQFNMGVYPKESMQKVIDIKFHPKGTYYEGGSMAKGGKVGGRGFFGLKKGKRITSPEELGVGDIVLAHSDQFNADNTIKITDRRTYGALVHLSGIYWNPITNKRIGYEEFGVAPELSGNKYYFPESKNISKGNWEVSVGDIYQVGDMQYKIIKGNSRDKVEYLTKWATEKEWDPNSGGSLSINNFAVKGLFNDKTRIHPANKKPKKKK